MGGQSGRLRDVSLLAVCTQSHRPLQVKDPSLPRTQEREEAAECSRGKENPAGTPATPEPQPAGKALALSPSLDPGQRGELSGELELNAGRHLGTRYELRKAR